MSIDPPASPSRHRSSSLLPLVVVVIVAGFVALLTYGVLTQGSNSAIDNALGQGQAPAAPPFQLPILLRGSLGARLEPRLGAAFARNDISLSELHGTPVILNIWASWCVPCQLEASTLERAWRAVARPEGVLFLGLDQQDATTDAITFMHHYRIDYANVHDAGNDIPVSYGATGVPETFAISANGRIVAHIIGQSSPQQLTAAIAAARSGRVDGTNRGGAEGSLQGS